MATRPLPPPSGPAQPKEGGASVGRSRPDPRGSYPGGLRARPRLNGSEWGSAREPRDVPGCRAQLVSAGAGLRRRGTMRRR